MKNLDMRKRLLTLLLTGTIAITASGCAKRVEKQDRPVVLDPPAQEEVMVVEPVQEVQPTPTVMPSPEPIGTVTIGENAARVVTMSSGLQLIRYTDHLAIVSGDILTTQPDNPLTSFHDLSGRAVTTTEVNYRLAPVVNKENKIRTLDEGTSLTIYGKTDDNWYLAECNGEIGFISGDYIRILTYDVDADYGLVENMVRVVPAVQATTNVKIRERATTESKQLDLLRSGHSIKMIRLLDNGWYEIEHPEGINGVAYVHGDYVRETIMVEGQYYKVGYLKNDAYIYDAPNGNPTGVVSQFESGEIYALENGYYLVATGDAQVGYIRRSDMAELTDTAVVVDISSQTLTVYSNNRIVLTAPIVSGRDTQDRQSDLGIFKIRAKETDRYLTDGSTYNSHVNYWMPYNGGEGLHDATWRSRFGGEIYKKNGSHGCINMPLEKAAELYDLVHVNDSVLVKR